MTLSEFLLARIAEDEAAARAAGGAVWVVDCPYSGDWGNPDDRARHLAGISHPEESRIEDADGNVVVYDEGSPNPDQAAHIARHDPARVLAEYEAKRAMVAEWDWYITGDWYDRPLRWLALPYADHPDYLPEWRP